MPKIKLIKLHSHYSDYEDGDRDSSYLGDGLTDWEEVSEEDLQLLKQKPYNYFSGESFVIIEEFTKSIPKTLLSIKEEIQKQKDLQLKREKERTAKEKKRLKTLEQKKIEKAKKLLQEKGLL